MRKGIEWLKDEIKVFQKGENMFTAEFNAGVQQALEYVQELLDQLDEPETLNEEWIENHTASADTISYYSEDSVPVVTVEKLKNLLVPKQDKPVIPQFVIDWIDTHNLYGNNPLREYRDLESDFNEGWTDEKDATVYHWVNKNPYAFIDALRYGCEVEKEQKYQVIIRDGEYVRLYLCKHEGNVTIGTNDNYIEKCPEVTYLTEQEIKEYDERYWAFAQEVTE